MTGKFFDKRLTFDAAHLGLGFASLILAMPHDRLDAIRSAPSKCITANS
jgi:hypothetical protein